MYYEKEKNGFRPEPRPTRVYNHDYVSSVLPHRGSRDTNLPYDLSRLSSDRGLPARSVVVSCLCVSESRSSDLDAIKRQPERSRRYDYRSPGRAIYLTIDIIMLKGS